VFTGISCGGGWSAKLCPVKSVKDEVVDVEAVWQPVVADVHSGSAALIPPTYTSIISHVPMSSTSLHLVDSPPPYLSEVVISAVGSPVVPTDYIQPTPTITMIANASGLPPGSSGNKTTMVAASLPAGLADVGASDVVPSSPPGWTGSETTMVATSLPPGLIDVKATVVVPSWTGSETTVVAASSLPGLTNSETTVVATGLPADIGAMVVVASSLPGMVSAGTSMVATDLPPVFTANTASSEARLPGLEANMVATVSTRRFADVEPTVVDTGCPPWLTDGTHVWRTGSRISFKDHGSQLPAFSDILDWTTATSGGLVVNADVGRHPNVCATGFSASGSDGTVGGIEGGRDSCAGDEVTVYSPAGPPISAARPPTEKTLTLQSSVPDLIPTSTCSSGISDSLNSSTTTTVAALQSAGTCFSDLLTCVWCEKCDDYPLLNKLQCFGLADTSSKQGYVFIERLRRFFFQKCCP